MVGPRITTANYALGATGGHCDETGFPPSMERTSPSVADSPEEFRLRVREMKKYGAGVIKICATGGVLCAQNIAHIRVTGTLNPVSDKEISPGVHIYDFGQNFVG